MMVVERENFDLSPEFMPDHFELPRIEELKFARNGEEYLQSREGRYAAVCSKGRCYGAEWPESLSGELAYPALECGASESVAGGVLGAGGGVVPLPVGGGGVAEEAVKMGGIGDSFRSRGIVSFAVSCFRGRGAFRGIGGTAVGGWQLAGQIGCFAGVPPRFWRYSRRSWGGDTMQATLRAGVLFFCLPAVPRRAAFATSFFLPSSFLLSFGGI